MILMSLVAVALAQEPATPLAGAVVDGDGTPVAGAELVLTSPTPGQSPVAARGESGEDGRFRLDRGHGGLMERREYLQDDWV